MLYIGTPSFYQEYNQDYQVVSFEMLPASEIMNLPQITNPDLKNTEKKAKLKKANQKADIQKNQPKISNKNAPKEVQKSTPNTKPISAVSSSTYTQNKKTETENSHNVATKINSKQDKTVKKHEDQPKKLEDKPKKKPEKHDKSEQPSKNLRKSLDKPSASRASPFDVVDAEDDSLQEDQEVNEDMIDERNFSTSQLYDEFNPLSITETMLIRRQIEKHWSPPVGLDSASGVQVMLSLKLTKDANIKQLKIKNVICPKRNIGVCRLVAESTLRAVRKAMPIKNLSADRYDIWGEFDLLFDPEDLL